MYPIPLNCSFLKFSLSASKCRLCWVSSASVSLHLLHPLPVKPVVPWSCIALHNDT